MFLGGGSLRAGNRTRIKGIVGADQNPLQCSCLENSMDCIVHGVTELDTTERLSLSFIYIYIWNGEKHANNKASGVQ